LFRLLRGLQDDRAPPRELPVLALAPGAHHRPPRDERDEAMSAEFGGLLEHGVHVRSFENGLGQGQTDRRGRRGAEAPSDHRADRRGRDVGHLHAVPGAVLVRDGQAIPDAMAQRAADVPGQGAGQRDDVATDRARGEEEEGHGATRKGV
jgi:hypothetical protein